MDLNGLTVMAQIGWYTADRSMGMVVRSFGVPLTRAVEA